MIHLVRWLYARLLWLYPQSFRAQFGDEMQQVFAQVLSDTARRGPAALLVVCARELFGVLMGGLVVRVQVLPWALLLILLGAAIAVGGLTAVTSIAVVMNLDDPWGPDPDAFLRITTAIFKLATLIAIVWLTGRAYSVIAGRRRDAVRAFLIWSVFGSICVVVLALTRDLWSALLSGATVKFYPNGVIPDYDLVNPAIAAHYAHWQAANAAGWVLVSEIGMVLILAALHAGIGFRWGHAPVRAVAAGGIASMVVGLLAHLLLPWSRWDYDAFIGSTLPGIVWMDAFLYLGEAYPYTVVASFFYMSVVAGLSLVILAGCQHTMSPVSRLYEQSCR
jgi:uncharacterized protein YhhL (DUF1145 family)